MSAGGEEGGTLLAERLARAQALHRQGQSAAARALYQVILQADPDHVEALNAIGALAGQANEMGAALQYFDRAIAAEPLNPAAHVNRGNALRRLGQPEAALASFDQAIALNGNEAVAHYGRAEILRALGRGDEASASYDRAVAANPQFVQAHFRRATLLQEAGALGAAVSGYDQTIVLAPLHADAHANKGVALSRLRRFAEAVGSYDEAIAIRPDQAVTYLFRANALKELQRFDESLANYDQALAIDPTYVECHVNRGVLLSSLGRSEEALASYASAISVKPDCAEAYFNRAYLNRICGRFNAAKADYCIAAQLAPDIDYLAGARLEVSLQTCDWSDFEMLVAEMTEGISGNRAATHPFNVLAVADSPSLQLRAAQIWVRHSCPADESLGPLVRSACAKRLRIGYFSADFREHPLYHLLAELIETHDRSKFEIFGFAFGPAAQDEPRRRAHERLRSIHRCPGDVQRRGGRPRPQSRNRYRGRSGRLYVQQPVGNLRAARGAAANQLPRLSRHARRELHGLHDRGSDGRDRAERTLLRRKDHLSSAQLSGQRPEAPHCRSRLHASGTWTPGERLCVLLLQRNYKILPATFDSWLRILKRVRGSVLMLVSGEDTVRRNLRTHAAQRAVDPQRLIFVERLPGPDYLARYRVADLFLDTHPYNAGTTASDALWAGLPVITMAGRAYAARVGASLLHSIGLPELVTTTREEYEDLAVELALDGSRLARLKDRLAQNRPTAPLFDTDRFARNLEAAYAQIQDRYEDGLPPEHITISAAT